MMDQKMTGYRTASISRNVLLWLIISIVLCMQSLGYNITSDNMNYYVSAGSYNVTLSKSAQVKDLIVGERDFIGDDHYDGFDNLFLSTTALGGAISINSTAIVNNTIYFNSDYANISYTFEDNNNITLQIDVRNQSSWLRLYVPINNDNLIYVNDTNSNAGESISDYMCQDAAWDNVTFTSSDRLKVLFTLINATDGSNPAIVDYGNNHTIMWVMDNLDAVGGVPMYKNNNYTIVISIDNSSYDPSLTNFNISISSLANHSYLVNTTLYNAEFSNCKLINLFMNASSFDILGDETQAELSGLYIAKTNPASGVLAITNSSFNTTSNTITCYGNNTNFTYAFFKSRILLDVNLNQSATWTRMYLVANPESITRISHARNSSLFINIPGGWSNKPWEDVMYTTVENAKLRFYLKRDRPLGLTAGELDYYSNDMIYSIDNMNYGIPMQSNKSYSYVLSLDLANFEPKNANSSVEIHDDNYWYTITADDYKMILTKEGMIKDLFFGGVQKDLLGDDFQEYFNGIYLAQQGPSSGVYIAQNSSATYNSVTFYNPNLYWKYTFFDDKVELLTTVNGTRYVRMYFNPKMSRFSSVRQRNPDNLSNMINFSAGNMVSRAWPEVTYSTKENLEMSLYLNNHPITHMLSTEGQTNYYSGNQLWCVDNLESSYGGMPMEPGYTYRITLLLNKSNFAPPSNNIQIIAGTDYTVYTNNYTAKINQSCIITELRFKSSKNNFLGFNNYSGIFLSSQNMNTGMIYADSVSVDQNSIICSNPNVNWSYQFGDDEITMNIKNNNVSWLRLYTVLNKNVLASLKEYNSSQNMSAANLTNKSWISTEFTTNENGKFVLYLANDHNLSSAKPELDYVNQTLAFSLDNLNTGLPMPKGNYYNFKVSFNTSGYSPLTFTEMTYTRSYDSKSTRAMIVVNTNFTSTYPTESMPLVIALHPLNVSIDMFLSLTSFSAEVLDRNWTMIMPEVYGRNSSFGNHSGYDLSSDEMASDIIDAINAASSLYNINTSRIYFVTVHNTGLLVLARKTNGYDIAASAAYWPVTNLTRYAIDINQSKDGLKGYYPKFYNELGCYPYANPFEYERVSAMSYYPNYDGQNIRLYHNTANNLINYSHSQEFYNSLISYDSDNLDNIYLIQTSANDTLANINATELFDWFSNMSYNKSSLDSDWIYDTNLTLGYVKAYIRDYNPVGANTSGVSDNASYFMRLKISKNNSANSMLLNRSNANNLILNLSNASLNITDLHLITFGERSEITFPYLFGSNTSVLEGEQMDVFFDNLSCITNISSNSSWNFSSTLVRPYVGFASLGINLTNQIWYSRSLNFSVTGNGTLIVKIPAGTYPSHWILYKDGVMINTSNSDSMDLVNYGTNCTNYTLMADTIAPAVTLNQPSPNGSYVITTNYFDINASFNEDVTSCIFNLNGVNYAMTLSNNVCSRHHTQNLNDATNQTYYIKATDASSNNGYSDTVIFRIDWNNAPNPPILMTPANNSYINNNTINLSWSAVDSDNDNLSFRVNISSFNESFIYDTNYTSISLNLADNRYNWTVSANDSVFNTVSNKNTFIVDTRVPYINITMPSDKSNYSIWQISMNYTANETLSSCVYFLNNASNNTSCANMMNSSQGTNNISIYACDLAGNCVWTNISYYVDSINPSVILSLPENNSFNKSTDVVFYYNVTDASAIRNCSLIINGKVNVSNSSIVTSDNSFTSTLTNGICDWGIRCIDFLHNSNTSSNRSLIIDTVIPPINLTYPLNRSYGPREFLINVSSNETLTSCSYALNDGAFANCSMPFNGSQGRNNLTINISDLAYNTNILQSEFYINLTPPDINFMDPTPSDGAIINLSSVTIRINSSNNLTGCRIMFGNVSSYSNYAMIRVSDHVCEINFTDLIDYQNYTYSINASNDLGNLNYTSNRTFRTSWNNAPGAVSLIYPLSSSHINNATVNFNWTPSMNVDDDNITYTLVIAAGSNISENYTLYESNATNLSIYLENESLYTWYVIANDSMLTNYSPIYDFTLDVTAPVLDLNIPDASQFSQKDIAFALNSSENGTCNYIISNNSGNSTFDCTLDSNLSSFGSFAAFEKNNTLSFFVTDISGNIGYKSSVLYVDSLSPSIELLSFPSNNTRTRTEKYNITAYVADENMLNCSLYINSECNSTQNKSEMVYDPIHGLNASFYLEINNTDILWGIYCIDLFNHSTYVADYALQVDNSAPISLTIPGSDMPYYNEQSITFNTTSISSDFDECMYNYENATVNMTYLGCDVDINLSLGMNSITVYVNDTLNNLNIRTINVTADYFDPQITGSKIGDFNLSSNSSGNSRAYYTNKNIHNISFDIYDDNALTCNLSIGDFLSQNLSINQSLPLSSGSSDVDFSIYIDRSINWSIGCEDEFRNLNAIYGTILFKNTSPMINISYPIQYSYVNTAQIPVNMTIDVFESVSLNVTGNESSQYFSSNSSNNLVSLSLGQNNISIYVNDSYQNNISANISVFFDNSAPYAQGIYGLLLNSSEFNLSLNITEDIPSVCLLNISDYENLSALYFLNLTDTTDFGFDFEFGSAPDLMILSNKSYLTAPYYKQIIGKIQSISFPLNLTDSSYSYNLTCEDYATNIKSINGTFYMDSNAPTISTNLSSISNLTLGDDLIFDVRAYKINSIKYSIISYLENHTQLNYTLNPNVPYKRIIFDTNQLDDNESYLFLINVTSSSGRTTSQAYNLNIGSKGIELNMINVSLPYGVVNVNSVFTINYTSINNISKVQVYGYGPANFVLNNSNISIKNVSLLANGSNYIATFNYTFRFAGNYLFEIYLEDIYGNVRRQKFDTYDFNYTVYAAQHNATLFVTSPNMNVNVSLYYGPLSYNMSLGTSNLVVPNVPFEINITTNESIMLHVPQSYTNILVGSVYVRKIFNFTNQSYFNSSYFSGYFPSYAIRDVYVVSATNLTNSYELIFNMTNVANPSRVKILKAPFNEFVIFYSNDSMLTPNVSGTCAKLTVSSFSIFAVVEDTTSYGGIDGGSGGGGAGGSGGGGGGGSSMNGYVPRNQTIPKNETLNQTANETSEERADASDEPVQNVTAKPNPYVERIKKNYPMIIWTSMILLILGITSGYAVQNLQFKRYTKLSKEKKLDIINEKFDLTMGLIKNSKATHEDKIRMGLLKARIDNLNNKDSLATSGDLDDVYKDTQKMLKKYSS